MLFRSAQHSGAEAHAIRPPRWASFCRRSTHHSAAEVDIILQSGKDNRFVVWFGIASATAAPTGLALLGYAISRSDDEIIQQLAKVPEIERLIEQAKTQEELML